MARRTPMVLLSASALILVTLGTGGLAAAEGGTPTPTTAAPTTSVPTATKSTATATAPVVVRPERAAATPTVTISEFDCATLTALVTIDNSRASTSAALSVDVWVMNADHFEPFSHRDLSIDPGATQLASADLSQDAYNRVEVRDPIGDALATREGRCGQNNVDPRAEIGSFDCTALTAAVTLDNSGSTVPITFHIRRFSWMVGGGTPEYSTDVEAGAGRRVHLAVPLADAAKNTLYVYAGPGYVLVASQQEGVICGQYVQARIGAFDCRSLSVPVTLDNSRSTKATAFEVWSAGLGRPTLSQGVAVAAGRVEVVPARLYDNAVNQVWVRGPEASWLNSAEHTCGRYVLNPRATFGGIDCKRPAIGVLLDNTRSTDRARFWLMTGTGYESSLLVPAGAARAFSIPLARGSRREVVAVVDDTTSDHNILASTTVAVSRTCPAPTKTAPDTSHSPSTASGVFLGQPAALEKALAMTGTNVMGALGTAIGLVALGAALLMARRRGTN